ncbi:permease [Clostridium perfringens]|uniref:permease n=1 Tax=Clostridium perfringens TaxID=1502 RepID=UPI000D70F418|nr:permease [Clostridium perfringens]PWW90754.1 permease [Clostridium perfringens]PWX70068.1 permease [Clostridium perfringens]
MLVGFLNFLLIIVLGTGLMIIMHELSDPSFRLIGITGLILTSSSILLLGLINNFISRDMKLFVLSSILYIFLDIIISIFLLRKEIKNKIFKNIIWGSLIISWLFSIYLMIICLGNIILSYIGSL